MENWRSEALVRFPELDEDIRQAMDPMQWWIELHSEFASAYEKEIRDEDFIKRTYHYAFWCMEHGEQDKDARLDLPTCVAVCFLEDLPSQKSARDDMPRWFSRDDVIQMRQIFSYHLAEGEFEQLLKLFDSPLSKRRARREERKRTQAKRLRS